jgi:hypothetical protein
MHIMSGMIRTIIRAGLWLVVTFTGGLATLWLFEQLLLTGIFGFYAPASGGFYVAWGAVAFAVGNATAFGCDRLFTRHRERSRRLGCGVVPVGVVSSGRWD